MKNRVGAGCRLRAEPADCAHLPVAFVAMPAVISFTGCSPKTDDAITAIAS